MLYNALLLPLVGLLLSAGESSRIVRLLFLAIAGAALLRRPKTHPDATSAPRNSSLFRAICIFQLVQSMSWVLIYINKPAGLELSRLPLFVLSLLPWLAIWASYSSGISSTKLLGLYPSSLGVVLWGCTSVVLDLLNFSSDSTIMIYGGVVEGTVLSNSRTVLPGFPGIVSGGVMCGLGIVCLIGAISKARPTWSSGWIVIPICLLANGIRVTDTRSSAVLVLLFPIIAAVLWLYPKRPSRSQDKWLDRIPKVLVACSVISPFVTPILFPALEKIDFSAELIGLASQLLRTTTESIFSFSGRSGIWSTAFEAIADDGLTIASFHPLGEFGAGVADVLFMASSMPGTADSAHSHNGVLNYYFSFGTVGLLFLITLFYRLYKAVGATGSDNEWRELQFPFAGFMMFFAFESLLSPQYMYFGLYFTLLSLDIYCQSRRQIS